MSEKNATPTRFRLLSTAVEEFAWLRTDGTSTDLDHIDVTFAFELSVPDRRVGVTPRFTFRRGEEDVLILQPILHFELHETDWPALLDEAGNVILSAGLLQPLAVIAVGFSRGVLYEKAQRQPGYQQLMLPIIPVMELVTEDLTFE